ncbi:MAG TPA: hypothetical protein VGL46_18655, partial [Pseudonocardiaceae bacterium]
MGLTDAGRWVWLRPMWRLPGRPGETGLAALGRAGARSHPGRPSATPRPVHPSPALLVAPREHRDGHTTGNPG